MTPRRVQTWALLAFAALLVVVAVTGLWLTWFYLPQPEVPDELLWSGYHAGALRLTRLVHRIAGCLLVAPAGVLVALRLHERRWGRAAAGAAVGPAILAAGFTGYLLPWDQLALRAVTVGTSMRGLLPILRDQVRFVIIGGVDVEPDTYRRAFVAHATLGALVAVLGGVAAWRRRPKADRGDQTPSQTTPS